MNDIRKKLMDYSVEKGNFSDIARYFLDVNYPEQLQVSDAAKACFVSNSSIVRFCKKLGYSGFSDFKYSLYNSAQENEYPTQDFSSYSDIHFQSIMNSFYATKNMIKEEDIQKLVECIHDAKNIVTLGAGSTALVANDLEYKFDRIGKHCKTYNDNILQYFNAKNATSDTLFIGLTYSGTSKNIIKYLKVAQESGAKTCLITHHENAHLLDIADITIFVSSSDSPSRLITTTARLTLLYTNDLLYMAYLNRYKEEVDPILMNNKFM